MSFFHEPPPLDSDVPPPLDDKNRDNDYDLEDEEIIVEDSCLELPELPTDFNVFSSIATDDSITYTHQPPELPDFAINSPDETKVSKIEILTKCDVAKEKESLKSDEVSQETLIGKSVSLEGETVTSEVEVEVEVTTDDNIPKKDDVKVLEAVESEDDDFNDFVAGDVKTESVAVLETEVFSGSVSEVDDFTGFATYNDIPEPNPELTLDDDDDDFNDFESAIPVNRQVEVVLEQTETPEVVQFEADFSGFNAFSEETVEDDFQDFKTATTLEPKSQLNENEDDDDDFGEFSDFTQAPQPVQAEIVEFVKPANVNGILDMMFPPLSSSSEEKTENCENDCGKIIKSDNFVNKFHDFDSTLALGYLYSNSKSSQTLVKALGIDTRNILLGPQWASSSASSNMPRFAANLSFNPIEPMKPTTSTVKSSTEAKPTILQPTKAPTEVVPEAEFDWNSSGLVNPLDGSQPKPQQPLDAESIKPTAPSTHPLEDESSLYVVDQEVTQVFEAEAKGNAGHKPELNDTYQWATLSDTQHHGLASSNNILVRERTIKLPETHIFTPVKGTSPVAREVISRDVSPSPDDPYFTPKGSIVVKEYHDVEYSLEPKKKIDFDNEFDDFQSAQPKTEPLKAPQLVPLNLLEPQKIEKPSTEIKWPEPGKIVETLELDFLETVSAPPASAPAPAPMTNFNLTLPPPPSIKKKELEFSKPVIGTSPTELNGGDDDDFNDFQAAPINPSIKPTKKVDQITLSPARLVATAAAANQKSPWISAMDDDEISRIEAAFPKCKTEKKSAQKSNHDDDWSDFVAAQPQIQPPSTISSNNMSRLSNGDTDDWSDFVSVPPPVSKIPSAKSSGAISSQFPSKPNFSSWNQPIGKHQYVNHSTSFLTSGATTQQFTSNNYPFVSDKIARQSMNITDNFSYAFNHPDLTNSKNNHQQQQQKPNGISTILPELDFAMPKNLINLPRGGNLDPGKK